MTRRGTRPLLWAVAVAGSAVALQDLYVRSSYKWSSPIDGVLESGDCLIEPLCDRRMLISHHLGLLALLVAVIAFAALFRRDDRYALIGSRPATAGSISESDWMMTLPSVGLFRWLSAAMIIIVAARTLLGNTVGATVWILAMALGAVAAWRCDRASSNPSTLASSMAHLAIGLGIGLSMLGIGSLWVSRPVGVLPLLLGLALFVWGMRLSHASSSSFDHVDHVAMFGLALLTLILAMLRQSTWRYAFIGDEWSFFEAARDILHNNSERGTFEIVDPNGYYTHLTYQLQATVMRFSGQTVSGWRLSSVLPVVLSVPMMYAFTKWLAGRTAAMVAAAALGVGHMLLSFSMVSYNSTQALAAVAVCFAALAFAHQRPSALRFYLLGAACGSTFLVYATARIAIVPIGLFFLVLFREQMTNFWRRLGWSALGGLAVAAPTLFSGENWSGLLKATPAQAEDSAAQAGRLQQMATNVLRGFLSFIGGDRNTHFVAGPHLDIIGAVLLIVGVGWAASRLRRDSAVATYFVGAALFSIAINGISQYDDVSNTRSFMLPAIYCVFVGLAAALIAKRVRVSFGVSPSVRVLGLVAAILFIGLLAGVNQLHISRYANNVQQLTEQAVLIREFQDTEKDGQGVKIHVAWLGERNARLNMLLQAHQVPRERFTVTSADMLLTNEALCSGTAPAIVAVHHRQERRDDLVRHFEQCWGTTAVEAKDPSGALKVLRLTNNKDLASAPQWPKVSDSLVDDAVDMVVDGAGNRFALTRSREGVRVVNIENGESFDVRQRRAIDIDITQNGLFVVASEDGDPRLTWYDGNGGMVNRYIGHAEFPTVGGVTVDGEVLWLSDPGGGRVVAFNEAFEPIETRYGEGLLLEPSALANGPDGSLWVYNSRAGEVVLLNAEDQIVTSVDAEVFAPLDAPRINSTADGLLVHVFPDRPEVQLVETDGAVVAAHGGFLRPRAATIDTDGAVLVADPRWTGIAALGTTWGEPPPRGVVAWGESSPDANTTATIGDPILEQRIVETTAVPITEQQVWRPVTLGAGGQIRGIAADRTGGAVVADTRGRMVRLDSEGATIEIIAASGGGSTELNDIAVDDQDVAWIIDGGNGLLYAIDRSARPNLISRDGGIFSNARGIGVGIDGSLWVASTARERVMNVSREGAVLNEIILPGTQPSDVVQRPDGLLWVVDAGQIQLLLVTPEGSVERSLPLTTFTSVEGPQLATDGQRLWMTDPEAGQVVTRDLQSGEPVGDAIALRRPDGGATDKAVGISVEPGSGRLWIVDSRSPAITILQP